VRQSLADVAGLLDEIDRRGVGVGPERYAAVAERLASLPGPIDRRRLFQVELVKPGHRLVLGQAVVDEVLRGVELLWRLYRPPRIALDAWREAFVNRYEGREVPLLEALDPEVGIAYRSGFEDGTEAVPLLRDLKLPADPEGRTVRWTARDTHMLSKLVSALRQGDNEILLSDRDLEIMETRDRPPLPDALAATVTVLAGSDERIDQGDYRLLLHQVSGPSGARMLGRFCHADPQLERRVREHIAQEERLRPDVTFAEIVHLPSGRLGNIVARPAFREFEIVYLGGSGVPPERQIPADDLTVSVRGERIVLRSKRLGREIVPRLTSMHNHVPPANAAVYRFLCALQGHGMAEGLAFDWGPLAGSSELPRVRSGRFILSKARWRLSKFDLQELAAASNDGRHRLINEWRTNRRLPQRVALNDGDNELLVDFDRPGSVDAILQLVRNRTEASVSEVFFDDQDLCLTGPDGRFTHELVVPFVRSSIDVSDELADVPREGVFQYPHVSPLISASPQPTDARYQRLFPPGSEWLYLKLYTSEGLLEWLLSQQIKPLVANVREAGLVDSWFFIRYGDPEWHLRLRLHGDPTTLMTRVLPLAHARLDPLLQSGALWKVQLDTYDRETERYGGLAGVQLAEKLFEADSEAVFSLVNLLAQLDAVDPEMNARWQMALLGMDRLLDDLGLNLPAKRSILRATRDSFAREHRADAAVKRKLGERWRSDGPVLLTMLSSDPPDIWQPALDVLATRSAALAPIAHELQTAEQAGALSARIVDLAPSFLHMHANRLLESTHRRQEMVIYDLLTRVYDSWTARGGVSA
jgi:thiopeptide-type bacteriocin biosynthesis protein